MDDSSNGFKSNNGRFSIDGGGIDLEGGRQSTLAIHLLRSINEVDSGIEFTSLIIVFSFMSMLK